MTIWRMSFRAGNRGEEMWPECRRLGVAAIHYSPLVWTDLSKHPMHEPKDLWAQLAPSQKASLRRVAYDMKEDDLIYVKQGPRIVGNGVVIGPYRFDATTTLIDRTGDPWAHQVPVEWATDFPEIEILLGSEQRSTVMELKPDDLKKLKTAVNQALVAEASVILPEEIRPNSVFTEGSVVRIPVNRYERVPLARMKCISHYGSRCSVCGFDFSVAYGDFMDGYIHVHHLVKLSTIGGSYQVDPISDLRPVCPNCHAALHQREPPYSIEEMKNLIKR